MLDPSVNTVNENMLWNPILIQAKDYEFNVLAELVRSNWSGRDIARESRQRSILIPKEKYRHAKFWQEIL